jgi:hypothetical protein
VKAAEAASKQHKVAEDFTTTFPDETVQTWKEMVDKWQKEPSSPNPYVSNERGMFFLEGSSSHVLQLFCQHRSFLRFDCVWPRKRLPRQSVVGTHHTRLLTGGKGEFTQWVHCEFLVSPETIRLVVTQQVCGGFF